MRLWFRCLVVAFVCFSFSTAFARGPERRFVAYITGYGYWDNTPPGSSTISHPGTHRHAGGTGTYRDPITIAVGHSYIGLRDILDYPAGTIFYLMRLKKYAIVEDTCGDGLRPQDGPCHTGMRGYPWFDIWVGGENSSKADSARCQSMITALQMVIINPKPNYEVHPGAVLDSGCKVF